MPGVTPSERYLAQLARHSFLSLWSYTNLFTDEYLFVKRGRSQLLDFSVLGCVERE